MKQPLFEAIERYIEELFLPADLSLEEAIRAADAAGMPPIQISPSQGKLLYLLAKLCGASRILELGTLAGYSTIWLGRALPAGGRLVTLELVPKHAEIARGNIERPGLGEMVEIRVGPALDSLAELQEVAEAPFDLIFIDADKPGYTAYLEAVLPLTRPGTLILADNVIRAGGVLDAETEDYSAQGARAFNAALAAHPRVEAVLLQQVGPKGHDGLAIARVKA